MKKTWEEPRIQVQQFTPNEYVAACVTGTIQCMYPGNGYTNGKEIYDDYNNDSSGWYTEPGTNLQHGVCGNDATISFNGDNATGFEFVNGAADPNRRIFNIKGYDQKEGTYTVTWNSQDGNSAVYTHMGRLRISNVDDTRPNHS